jgi:IS5 family transposase
LDKAQGLALRQSYARPAKRAALMASLYTHAKQVKRPNGELRFLRLRLGRLIRDVRRKIEGTQELIGREIERTCADKGYRGHNAPKPLRVVISGQKRGDFGTIKRELRRRSAIEPVIGHMKSDGHLDRNYLKGRHGDHTNAVLSAVGLNLRLQVRCRFLDLNWLRLLLPLFLDAILAANVPSPALKPAS